MKRWNVAEMLEIGKKLFAKMHKQKYHAHHNNELHFMAREIDDWLPTGIHQLCNGAYSPRPLRRYFFPDETVDQVHPTDRIFQHILLQLLKPTFKHVMNANCYHLYGPTGVKYATQRIRQVLEEKNPEYVIRVDIKSFYKSIPHFKLIQDIKKYYNDPKLLTMLEEIIINPIDTPHGYKNPVHGIALRGPLSQFFSGIYLKPLDDAFNEMDVDYFRFQDDALILCRTKRQMNRCRRRMMEVLRERRLTLSRKKSRIGLTKDGFHYLGVSYSPTQPVSNTNVVYANDVYYLSKTGGGVAATSEQEKHVLCITPHARTLRKARIQVQQMVTIGFSTKHIRRYLDQFIRWWAKTIDSWTYQKLVIWFVEACWDIQPSAHAVAFLQRHFIKLETILLCVNTAA